MVGNIFIRKLSFFGRKNILEYFMGKSGALHGNFSDVGESRIIKTPINHIVDTHLAIILIHTTLAAPFCTWLLRSFFDSVPYELEEAAEIDGCGKFQAFFRICFPISAPGILTAGIYAMISSWGEYLFVLILINSGTKKTVPLALAAYMSHVDIQWGRLLAGSALNVLPILIIFLPLTKYFLKGFMEGALK